MKYLEKQKARLKVRRKAALTEKGDLPDTGYKLPGSMNRHKSTSIAGEEIAGKTRRRKTR